MKVDNIYVLEQIQMTQANEKAAKAQIEEQTGADLTAVIDQTGAALLKGIENHLHIDLNNPESVYAFLMVLTALIGIARDVGYSNPEVPQDLLIQAAYGALMSTMIRRARTLGMVE